MEEEELEEAEAEDAEERQVTTRERKEKILWYIFYILPGHVN